MELTLMRKMTGAAHHLHGALECETITVSRIKLFFKNNVEIEFFYRPWVISWD